MNVSSVLWLVECSSLILNKFLHFQKKKNENFFMLYNIVEQILLQLTSALPSIFSSRPIKNFLFIQKLFTEITAIMYSRTSIILTSISQKFGRFFSFLAHSHKLPIEKYFDNSTQKSLWQEIFLENGYFCENKKGTHDS